MSAWSRCTVDHAIEPCSEKGEARVHVSAKLLEGTFCSEPPVPLSVKMILTSLRDRQEQFFKEVLEQQKEVQNRLERMNTAVIANTDSQVALKQHQMEFLNEYGKNFRKVSHNTHRAQMADHGVEPYEEIATTTSKQPPRQVSSETNSSADQSREGSLADDSGAVGGRRPSVTSVDSRWSKSGRKTKNGLSLTNHSKDSPGGYERTNDLKYRMNKFLKRKEFEFGVAFAIMGNAFVMCWECQYQGLNVGYQLQFRGRQAHASEVWPDADVVFQVCDWFFGILFLFEFLVKIVCWGRRYLYIQPMPVPDPEDFSIANSTGVGCKCPLDCLKNLCMGLQGWNMLDLSCVLAFIFDKAASIGAGINPQLIRLLRLFRLFRMVRLVRFLESLDHLYIMTTAISSVKDVLIWAILLLTIMLLTCDLFLVQILHATYFDSVTATELSPEQLEKHHQMFEYFGTTTRCMLSMFEITLGNWPPVARLLSEEASEWFTLFCLLHKLTIGFAVISVISGVILQETFKVAQTDDVIMLRQKKAASVVLQRKLQSLFEELDDSGDGRLEMDEVERIGQLPDIKIWLGSLGIETDDVKTLFELVDLDGDGFISADEMSLAVPRLRGPARALDLMALQKQMSELFAGLEEILQKRRTGSTPLTLSRQVSPSVPDYLSKEGGRQLNGFH